MAYPVILGSGRRLFPDDLESKTTLSLVDTTVFENGVFRLDVPVRLAP